jgi:hypothetical protein
MLQFSRLSLMRTPQGEVKYFAYRVWLPVALDDHLLLSLTIFPFQFFFHWLRHTISRIVADTGRMFSRHLGKLNTPKAKCVSNERQTELITLYVKMKQAASLYYGSPGKVKHDQLIPSSFVSGSVLLQ